MTIMKTPYEKYKATETRLWEKFKLTVRDICLHPKEYVTSIHRYDEDEYGCCDYNRSTSTYNCKYCGETWYVDNKRTYK